MTAGARLAQFWIQIQFLKSLGYASNFFRKREIFFNFVVSFLQVRFFFKLFCEFLTSPVIFPDTNSQCISNTYIHVLQYRLQYLFREEKVHSLISFGSGPEIRLRFFSEVAEFRIQYLVLKRSVWDPKISLSLQMFRYFNYSDRIRSRSDLELFRIRANRE